ncbi:MAG: hypothetical protein AAGE52_15970 [Myxococcota bacterium]
MRPWVVICALLCLPGLSRAQDADAATRAFDRGIQAQNEGLLSVARDAFRQALALAPSRAAAFNLAYVLKSLEQTTEAIALFERLSDGEFGSLREEQASEVDALLEESRRELARVSLSVCGVPEPQVRIDGERTLRLRDCSPHALLLDAGRHVFSASAERVRPEERALSLRAGQELTLRVDLEPPPRRPLRRNPWIWVAVGVVVAGGIALAIGLSQRQGPYVDDVFGVTDTLRSGP